MLFVGVIRSSTSLRAVLLRPVVPYRLPGPGEIGGPAYRLESMPLEESRMGSERQRRTAARLLEDWSALGEVSALDAFTLARVLRVLLETRAGAARTRPHLPPLDPGEEKRVFRPTAAHPRGYRGTRDRPPKAGLPRPYDLRRWLASSEGVNVLLRRLSHHWPRARSILLKFG